MHQISKQEITFLLQHLQMESKFLDFIIERSEKIREHLASDLIKSKSSTSDLDFEIDAFNVDEVQRLDEFVGLADGRTKLNELLRSCANEAGAVPTLRDFIRTLPNPVRDELKTLRTQLNHKLRRVQTVNSGTQAILTYTLSYYEKFQNGLSDGQSPTGRYSSSGTVARLASRILQRDC